MTHGRHGRGERLGSAGGTQHDRVEHEQLIRRMYDVCPSGELIDAILELQHFMETCGYTRSVMNRALRKEVEELEAIYGGSGDMSDGKVLKDNGRNRSSVGRTVLNILQTLAIVVVVDGQALHQAVVALEDVMEDAMVRQTPSIPTTSLTMEQL